MPGPAANPRLRLHVVHETASLLVVNKMPGMPSEPGKGHAKDSVLNAVAVRHGPRMARLGEVRDWGLVHRLDRLSSGLLTLGLEPDAYDRLREAFERREVRKTYLAIVKGTLPGREGRVETPLAERLERGYRVSVADRAGRPAVTEWRELARHGKYAIVECGLPTGRLHQIRVHLASIGAPLAGDPLYVEGGLARPATGRDRDDEPRFHLHAWKLSLPAGAVGGEADLDLVAELPRLFREAAADRSLPPPE